MPSNTFGVILGILLEADDSAEPAQRLESTRAALAKLPPLQALAICYSRKWARARPIELVEKLRAFTSRNELLTWIYKDHRLFRDATYVRLPSASKRALVRSILADCTKRYSWLTSRILHAFAFRPSCFERKNGRARQGSQAWQGLYQQISIPKGRSRRRIIHIPVPPLRRLQRVLLRRCLNVALVEELGPCVFGCRPGPKHTVVIDGMIRHGANHTVYHNAASHIGQRFIVRFDLKDFFPSIRVDQVIPALLSLRTPAATRLVINEKEDGEKKVIRVNYPWTHDVAVLVARLVTRRGRLPQGAPTSPAIANLVFRAYDRKIIESLGGDFVYTRYVDDLVVSISAAAARHQAIESGSEMRSRVEDKLLAALKGSGFSINPRKTRTTSLEQGHQVTGIQVLRDVVDLRRADKRAIRSLVYNLKRSEFVRLACDRIGGEVAARTRYRPESVNHLFEGCLASQGIGVFLC